MPQVALAGCELEIVFAVPHDHQLTGVGFPLYDDVVVHEDHGESNTEEIDENIADASVAELSAKLLNEEGRVISWLAMKPGVKNHRIYVFFSMVDPALEMSTEIRAAVDELLAQTWGWGKMYVIRNTEGLDLININVLKPSGKKSPRHLFDIEDGQVQAFEAQSRKRTKREAERRDLRRVEASATLKKLNSIPV